MLGKIVSAVLTSLFFSSGLMAQENNRPFHGRFYNEEYQVFVVLNFYEKDIIAPDGELYGELDGYLGSKRDSRLWLGTSSEITDDTHATLSLINDYGSEDVLLLLQSSDNGQTLRMKKKSGGTLKIAVDGKWVKLPKEIIFKRE